jgi:hypothetical protein
MHRPAPSRRHFLLPALLASGLFASVGAFAQVKPAVPPASPNTAAAAAEAVVLSPFEVVAEGNQGYDQYCSLRV